MNGLLLGTPITLEALLVSRENRAARQKALLHAYGKTVLCLLVNIPGAVKDCEAARKAFAAGAAAITAMLNAAGIAVLHQETRRLSTGPEGYWAVDMEPQALKRRCMALEEDQPLGRLWDIDVIDPDGNPLSRRTITGAGRSCMVCGGPAADCVSRRKHTALELEAAISAIFSAAERT